MVKVPIKLHVSISIARISENTNIMTARIISYEPTLRLKPPLADLEPPANFTCDAMLSCIYEFQRFAFLYAY